MLPARIRLLRLYAKLSLSHLPQDRRRFLFFDRQRHLPRPSASPALQQRSPSHPLSPAAVSFFSVPPASHFSFLRLPSQPRRRSSQSTTTSNEGLAKVYFDNCVLAVVGEGGGRRQLEEKEGRRPARSEEELQVRFFSRFSRRGGGGEGARGEIGGFPVPAGAGEIRNVEEKAIPDLPAPPSRSQREGANSKTGGEEGEKGLRSEGEAQETQTVETGEGGQENDF
jgi:hypothetical protein